MIGTQYYSWRSKESSEGAQIDMLIERADRVINLCEMKYSIYPYALDKAERETRNNPSARHISAFIYQIF